MSIRLLRCPFCGGIAQFSNCTRKHGYTVACLDCGATIERDDPRRAINDWNMRTDAALDDEDTEEDRER